MRLCLELLKCLFLPRTWSTRGPTIVHNRIALGWWLALTIGIVSRLHFHNNIYIYIYSQNMFPFRSCGPCVNADPWCARSRTLNEHGTRKCVLNEKSGTDQKCVWQLQWVLSQESSAERENAEYSWNFEMLLREMHVACGGSRSFYYTLSQEHCSKQCFLEVNL